MNFADLGNDMRALAEHACCCKAHALHAVHAMDSDVRS